MRKPATKPPAVPPPSTNAPPANMSAAAAEKWATLVGEVAPGQRDLLAVYCEAFADWREASERVAKYGRLVKDSKDRPTRSPWIAIRDNAASTMTQVAESLGLAMSGDVLAPAGVDYEILPPDSKQKTGIGAEITVSMVIKALRACGGIVNDAAIRLGISRRSFYEVFWGYPEVQQTAREIREELLDLSESNALRLLRARDREMTKYYLRCFGKERGWVETTRVEGAIGTYDLTKLSDEQLGALSAILSGAAAPAVIGGGPCGDSEANG